MGFTLNSYKIQTIKINSSLNKKNKIKKFKIKKRREIHLYLTNLI